MADRLKNIEGKAILSLNDTPEMRRIFDRFYIETTGIKYQIGSGSNTVDRTELIIYS